MNKLSVQKGWDVHKTAEVAALYDEAFSAKLHNAIRHPSTRMAILSQSFVPQFSYVVCAGEKIVGLAGFQTPEGSFTSGISLKDLIRERGMLKGLWAAWVFSLLERQPEAQALLLNTIVVDSAYRGCGIGSLLLDAILTHAQTHGFDSVKLDVVDSNPRAKKLYETKGFVAIEKQSFPYLKWLIGFSSATTMMFPLSPKALQTAPIGKQ